jgi:hypothetical protein
MDLNMRITRSRGGGMGRAPRDRPPTPRASGATSVLRTPSPNRARRSASRDRNEQMDGETQPNQENQPHIAVPSVQETVQPRLTNRNREIQEMMVNNLLQTDPGLQHPTGRGLLFHPTSKKPERMIEEHMKQEKSQVIQHMQDSGIGLMW